MAKVYAHFKKQIPGDAKAVKQTTCIRTLKPLRSGGGEMPILPPATHRLDRRESEPQMTEPQNTGPAASAPMPLPPMPGQSRTAPLGVHAGSPPPPLLPALLSLTHAQRKRTHDDESPLLFPGFCERAKSSRWGRPDTGGLLAQRGQGSVTPARPRTHTRPYCGGWRGGRKNRERSAAPRQRVVGAPSIKGGVTQRRA